jgi:hypothetical protein
LRLGGLALLLLSGAVGRPPLEGSYVARTLNGRPVPAELQIPTTGGDVRLFRLEQGVLRLSAGGRFTLYFRYYHQLVRAGAKPTSTPVMSYSENGTYTARSDTITLVPAKKKGQRSPQQIAAYVSGDVIRASYVLANGGRPERVTLLLRRDARYW